jgi:ketosteroid isomerase-like protein
MRQEENAHVAKSLLALLGGQPSTEDIASLFALDLQWEVAGEPGALPWIGKKTGRAAVAEFVRDTDAMLERLRFDVKDILVSDRRAVILGELASRVRRTGKTIETAFAVVLTIVDRRITRFEILEDSFAISQAAR